eukprot:TRINITY_DN66011_c0_g1_i1.p1 TRINITY_DN66011_c0_g1~~TRINITY_DN66011_c0_g1_i1.p1  ORF type:complete len:214 (+),score=72.78 TRINITY_DN66011_c0_g1_i1:79-642(+)
MKAFSPTHLVYDPSDPLGVVMCVLSLLPYVLCLALGVWYLATLDKDCVLIGLTSLVADVINYALKRVLQQARPSTAAAFTRDDYGMPSRHAQFCAAFVWTYGVVIARRRRRRETWLAAAISLSWCAALGCAYSRVHLGYHTPEQVLVGIVAGAAASAFTLRALQWRFLRGVVPRLHRVSSAVAAAIC